MGHSAQQIHFPSYHVPMLLLLLAPQGQDHEHSSEKLFFFFLVEQILFVVLGLGLLGEPCRLYSQLFQVQTFRLVGVV